MKARLAVNLKPLLRRAMPGPYDRLQEMWTRYRVKRVVESIVARHGLVVQSGPFSGMAYAPQATCSSLTPKLLGSYEAELHGVLAQALEDGHDRIVDIGCAEGYYAVGLARRLPTAMIHAFDINPLARELCENMASANGVSDRVLVAGECSVNELRALTSERSFIVCDCEGCELDLLRPDLAPGLRFSDVLVELHDFIYPKISQTIVSRFDATHEITVLDSMERDPAVYPALDDFSYFDRRVAVAEFREKGMQWAFMRSRSARRRVR